MENNITGLKIAYLSLGCKVNAYETASIRNQLESYGCCTVGFREVADVYLVNTCTVTNIADRKSRQMLHQAKRRNPDAIVVAAGCYVQEFYRNHEEDDTIDILIGNRRKSEIAAILSEYITSKKNGMATQQIYINEDAKLLEYEEMEIAAATENTRAYLKIQDGCNQFCSYCMIPYARGRISSRVQEDVIKEVEHLAQKGFQEFVLTGIHLSSYGLEDVTTTEQQKLKRNDGREPLLELIAAISEVPGVSRIRLGSLEPRIMREEFIAELSKLTKVCPHFHLSLQSGCDATLKAMNRKYTTEEYLKCCDLLRKYYKEPAITTDVIVGFPGETEEQFVTSMEFAKTCAFAQMHVFPFSRRRGTAADRMPNQLTEEIKKQREHRMLGIANNLEQKYREAKNGQECILLTEECIEINGQNWFIGHTEEYLMVAIPQESYHENQLIRVRISENTLNNYILAEPLGLPKA